MSNPQSPPQPHGSTNVVFIIDPWFDPSYFKTTPGMMKVAAIILDLLGFICIQSSAFWFHGKGIYFNTIAQLALWFSVIMLACYVYHTVEKYHNIKWLKIEMIAYIVFTFLYLTASTIVVAYGSPGYSAAGFFGYLAMVLYGTDAFLKSKALKDGEIAQGQKVVNKQEHTTPAVP